MKILVIIFQAFVVFICVGSVFGQSLEIGDKKSSERNKANQKSNISASSLSEKPIQTLLNQVEKLKKDKLSNVTTQKKTNQIRVEKSSSSKKKEKTTNFNSKVQILLGDGRSLKGHLTLKVPLRLHIKHIKDGITYYKDIRMQDIKWIEAKSWAGTFIKRQVKGEVYRFEISGYIIALKNGQKLKLDDNLLSFLREFDMSNVNGKVRLYSYWLDLYKSDKTWHTGMKGRLGNERVICHSDVIQKISFETVAD